jgi:hypothetical protein
MSLAGKNKDVPAVSLVFTGSLSDAGQIAPAVDTASIETYLTMRRMQEDVEKLETLDVTGRTPTPPMDPEPEPEPEPETAAVPLPEPKPDEIARPALPPAPAEPALPESAAIPLEPASVTPPPAMPAETIEPLLPAQPADATLTEDQTIPLIEDQVTPTTAEVPPEEPPAVKTPRRSPKRREAPDAWKKGISVFGG